MTARNRPFGRVQPVTIRRRRGFTLAEMIAALALLAFFSVIVVQLFAAAHTLAQRTDRLDGAVLCARNLAESWQAGIDRTKAVQSGTAAGTGASAAGIPVSPLKGIRFDNPPGQPVYQTFDSQLQPADRNSSQAAYVAELQMGEDQDGGKEDLRIIIRDPDGKQLFDLTVSRLAGGEVAP